MDNAVRADGSLDEDYTLEDSGERFLPGVEGKAGTAYDHIARYRFVERFVSGKRIADLGCGSGYGSHALSKVAERVTAMDLSEEAVAHARTHYGRDRDNLSYEVGDVTETPYEDGDFEAVVSFEVIEHLEDPEALMVEAKRLVGEDGVFIVSTPDKQTYSNDRNSVNLYHLREMYVPEFRELLEKHFEHVEIYRQGAVGGSMISRDGTELSGRSAMEVETNPFSLEDPEFGSEPPVAMYVIAVCTNGASVEHPEEPYLLLDRDSLIYEEYEDLYVDMRRLNTMARFHRARVREVQEVMRSSDLEGSANVQHELRRLRNVQRQLRDIQNSRSWKIIRRLASLKERAQRSAPQPVQRLVQKLVRLARRL